MAKLGTGAEESGQSDTLENPGLFSELQLPHWGLIAELGAPVRELSPFSNIILSLSLSFPFFISPSLLIFLSLSLFLPSSFLISLLLSLLLSLPYYPPLSSSSSSSLPPSCVPSPPLQKIPEPHQRDSMAGKVLCLARNHCPHLTHSLKFRSVDWINRFNPSSWAEL